MNTFFSITTILAAILAVGSILLGFGIMMMAGSANDCDGACMETANTLSEMLFVASIGLVMSFAGFMTLYSKIIK